MKKNLAAFAFFSMVAQFAHASELTQVNPFRPGQYKTKNCEIDRETFSSVYIHGHPSDRVGSLVIVFGDRYKTEFPTANHLPSISPMWLGSECLEMDLLSTDVATWDAATGTYSVKKKIQERLDRNFVYEAHFQLKTTKDGMSLDYSGPTFHRLDGSIDGHCELVFEHH